METKKKTLEKTCEDGHLHAINSLIIEGFDKEDILYNICQFGHTHILYHLVENCIVNTSTLANRWNIEIASQNGHINIVKYIAKECKERNCEYNTAICLALKNDHFQIAKFLANIIQ